MVKYKRAQEHLQVEFSVLIQIRTSIHLVGMKRVNKEFFTQNETAKLFRVHGVLTLNKVAGNFHITAGKVTKYFNPKAYLFWSLF